MRKISFTLKQFEIDDSHCGMKVGTDGVALGAWVKCNNVLRVADIGCGSGLIALMIAQRCGAQIDAIDIDKGACFDAINNVNVSPWKQLISVSEVSITQFEPTVKYDLIVSNPPFFAEGVHSSCTERALARHEDTLNFKTLIDFATKYLASSGRLAFIYQFGHEDEIIYSAEMAHLKLRRLASLRPTPNRPPIRSLFEFCQVDGPIEKEEIAIRNNDGKNYSQRFASLCRDFYLEL